RVVPERVVVIRAVVHQSEQGHALSVNGIALENAPVVVVGCAQTVICLVSGRITCRRLTFGANDVAGCLAFAVLLIADRALWVAADPRECHGSRGLTACPGGRFSARESELVIDPERADSRGPHSLASGEGEASQRSWRKNAMDGM